MSDVRRKLRERINQPRILLLPGVYDSICARLVQQAGFEAVYMTGSGTAMARYGVPDIGLVTMSEMASAVAAIADAVDLPLIADADTGYGNALNVQRTVKEYERAGVAALQFEDQEFPKRCGHLAGKQVIPAEEMVGKLKAALDARTDPDLLIIARTDARAVLGEDEALRRARLYEEAGADIIFYEAPLTIEEMRRATSSVTRPSLANMVEGGRSPLLNADELEAIGYRIALFANAVTRFIAKQVPAFLSEFKAQGGSRDLRHQQVSFDELQDIMDLGSWAEREVKYGGLSPVEAR